VTVTLITFFVPCCSFLIVLALGFDLACNDLQFEGLPASIHEQWDTPINVFTQLFQT